MPANAESVCLGELPPKMYVFASIPLLCMRRVSQCGCSLTSCVFNWSRTFFPVPLRIAIYCSDSLGRVICEGGVADADVGRLGYRNLSNLRRLHVPIRRDCRRV